MSRMSGRRLELVCILCNEALADLEKACSGHLALNANEDINKNIIDESIISEGTSLITPDQGRLATQNLGIGGYHSITSETPKDVVATKCGHMFHQGCLRKYVHRTLIDGKGGSLFCPICTRPFAMNRLWPVIIPATKAQKQRYIQLKVMKEQNADMVKQLKEIRTKITEEEAHLEQIKQDSEQCLQDIQQKQKLLDSVKGPTNKEMVELTKLHMKRQEILHVVTQHNADLLKLLAEESNISTTTAEQMINVKAGQDTNDLQSERSEYKNFYYPHNAPSSQRCLQQVPSSIYTAPTDLVVKRKSSKKVKAKKSGDKSKKKSRKKSRRHMQSLLMGEVEPSETTLNPPQNLNQCSSRKQHPSTVMNRDPQFDSVMKKFPGVLNPGCRTVDTFMKWNMESVRELMSLESFSESSLKDHPISLNQNQKDDRQHNHHQYGHDRNRQEVNAAQAPKEFPFPKKNSANIMLARKAPILLNKNLFDGLAKK